MGAPATGYLRLEPRVQFPWWSMFEVTTRRWSVDAADYCLLVVKRNHDGALAKWPGMLLSRLMASSFSACACKACHLVLVSVGVTADHNAATILF